jgi:plasmid stability protein
MKPVHLALPADLAHDLAVLAVADGRSVSDEGVLLLRRAVAGRQLRELLVQAGSDLDPDQAMQVALDEQRAHRRSR